ncbi:hypothetical protein EDB89DRAFT_233461 [Lactarius sanguifluus]|nr:hypothetical protein EDB89DRAFT_233461 [Lactarius sanguifluus]
MRPNCCRVLELARPFDASSEHHGADYLTFLDSRAPDFPLPNSPSSYSAKDRSVADEALHLTSAARRWCGHGRTGPRSALLHASVSALRIRLTPLAGNRRRRFRDEEASVGELCNYGARSMVCFRHRLGLRDGPAGRRLTPQQLDAGGGVNAAHPIRVNGRAPEDHREHGRYWQKRMRRSDRDFG